MSQFRSIQDTDAESVFNGLIDEPLVNRHRLGGGEASAASELGPAIGSCLTRDTCLLVRE